MSLRLLTLLFVVSLSLSFITITRADDCVYTIYVKTGSGFGSGSDSTISLKLYDEYGKTVEIANMETWGGLMGKRYNYFERNNLDIFSGRGKCLSSSICGLNVTSDGSGVQHSWYCSYVEITATGLNTPCLQQRFTVEQWLALDTAPRELTAVRNYCPSDINGQHRDPMIKKSPSIRSVV